MRAFRLYCMASMKGRVGRLPLAEQIAIRHGTFIGAVAGPFAKSKVFMRLSLFFAAHFRHIHSHFLFEKEDSE